MGVVWRAVDEVLGREVAVKELRVYSDAAGPELADLRLRMTREARAAARVRHPGVVAVHDVTEHEGRPVIVMELVDGPSLDDVLGERGPLDPVEAARIGARVLEALAAAHDVGVLHRDVKPGNILLDNPQALDSARPVEAPSARVVLTDFGIATMEDPGDGSATRLTRSGEIIGSLDFLAPERARGENPGPASDVWAVGATLYAAVEGASPFRRTSTWSTLAAIVTEPLPEPRRAGPLTPVLLRLLDKDPSSRPDAREAALLLGAVMEASAPAAAAPAAAAPVEGFGPPVAPVLPVAPVAPVAPEAPAIPGVSGMSGVSQEPLTSRGSRVDAGRRARAAGSAGRRRNALVAASVAAVLLAGGGITYSLMDHGTTQRAAGGSLGDGDAGGAPDGDAGRVLDPGGSGAPSSGVSGSSASPSGTGPDGATASGQASGGPGERGSATGGTGGDGSGGGSGSGEGSGTGSGSGSGSGSATGSGTGSGGAAAGADGGTIGGSAGPASGGGSAAGGATAPGTSDGGTAPTGDSAGASDGSGAGAGGSTAAPTTEAPQPPAGCETAGSSATCQVVRSSTTTRYDGGEMGTIGAGPHVLYCQVDLDHSESYGGVSSRWFARTDDDSGNTNVYLSVLNLAGGASGGPVEGLRIC
ncbi:serine/threonine-protein kinase [Streptomyces sp. NPDC055103]